MVHIFILKYLCVAEYFIIAVLFIHSLIIQTLNYPNSNGGDCSIRMFYVFKFFVALWSSVQNNISALHLSIHLSEHLAHRYLDN